MGNPRIMVGQSDGQTAKEQRELVLGPVYQINAMPQAMEEKLRENPEWFFTTLRSIGDAVVASDEKGKVTFLNQKAEVMTGWSLSDACGRRLQDILQIERMETDPAPTGGGCAGLRTGPRPALDAMNVWVASREGMRTPVEATTALIREGQGVIRGVVRILRDVTDRMRAEESLKRSELRYRHLVEKSKDILFTLSRQGIITSLNPAFEQSTGWPAVEYIYRPFSDLLHPEDREMAWAVFQKVLSGQSTPPLEMRIRSKAGGEMVLECGCAPTIENGRPAGVWGIARDVTQRKRLEQRVLQTQKMEAVSRLAGGIAHDFNNLLMAINGYTDFLKQSLGQNSPLLANVDGILSSVSRAASLTRQLLAFSRQKKSTPRRLDLNALIGGLLPNLTEMLEENISLEIDLGKSIGSVLADPAEMEEALMILIANAREAMPKGGRLSLRTSEAESSALPGSTPSTLVVITVADTGCGMNDSVMARLFEPFFTTKPIGKGMGLGLSTVYGLVKLGGGDILVESAPERGTTFRLTFPRMETGIGVEPAPQMLPESGSGGETILLVEDDEEVRFLLYSILRSDGYSVLEAKDGEHAIELAAAHKGRIHLILTDLHMPKLGGHRMVETMIPKYPGMKVMFMSGFSQEDFPSIAGRDLPVSFLQKPFMPKSLIRQIRKMLDG